MIYQSHLHGTCTIPTYKECCLGNSNDQNGIPMMKQIFKKRNKKKAKHKQIQAREGKVQEKSEAKVLRGEFARVNDTKTPSPNYQVLSPSASNAPLKTPSTITTSSSSIGYKPKSPTSSTSPSTHGYLNSSMSPPPRVPPPPPTQESGSMDITLTLSPITPLDVQFNTPLPPSPLFGHPIPWNLLEAHRDSCLCCIRNQTLIFGLRDKLQYMFSYIEHMLSQPPPPNSPPPPSLSPN
ncbi:hypothetical protein Tco_0516214 [Tanacetum coccineum]